MRSTDFNQFASADRAFIGQYAEVATLDPLYLHTDGLYQALQGSIGSIDKRAVAEVFVRAADWQRSTSIPEIETLKAVRRDVDKATGVYVRHKSSLANDVPVSRQVFAGFARFGIEPRADIYDYSLGAYAGDGATYTGEDREQALIDIFGDSLLAAHGGVIDLLQARFALADTDIPRAEAHLVDALEAAKSIQQRMVDAYREVGPAFVATEVQRYVGAIPFAGRKYEGPNPSHSAFMTLDRFALGSFATIIASSQPLADQIVYRMEGMPAHHVDAIQAADIEADNKSIVEHAAGTSLETLAGDIVRSIRKHKTVHKSYADKGLAAKHKTLSEEEPDLLSENVRFARSKEITTVRPMPPTPIEQPIVRGIGEYTTLAKAGEDSGHNYHDRDSLPFQVEYPLVEFLPEFIQVGADAMSLQKQLLNNYWYRKANTNDRDRMLDRVVHVNENLGIVLDFIDRKYKPLGFEPQHISIAGSYIHSDSPGDIDFNVVVNGSFFDYVTFNEGRDILDKTGSIKKVSLTLMGADNIDGTSLVADEIRNQGFTHHDTTIREMLVAPMRNVTVYGQPFDFTKNIDSRNVLVRVARQLYFTELTLDGKIPYYGEDPLRSKKAKGRVREAYQIIEWLLGNSPHLGAK